MKKLTEEKVFELANNTCGFTVNKYKNSHRERRRLAVRLLKAKRVVKFFNHGEEYILFSLEKAEKFNQMELKDEGQLHSTGDGH